MSATSKACAAGVVLFLLHNLGSVLSRMFISMIFILDSYPTLCLKTVSTSALFPHSSSSSSAASSLIQLIHSNLLKIWLVLLCLEECGRTCRLVLSCQKKSKNPEGPFFKFEKYILIYYISKIYLPKKVSKLESGLL